MENNYIEKTIRLVGTHRMMEYGALNTVRLTDSDAGAKTVATATHPATGEEHLLELTFLPEERVRVVIRKKCAEPRTVLDMEVPEEKVMTTVADFFHPELKEG